MRPTSSIVECPVPESITLKIQTVHPERTPVNRPVSSSELDTFQQGTIEPTEHAQVPVGSKFAIVTKEVCPIKQLIERDKVISDTVCCTETEVENRKS